MPDLRKIILSRDITFKENALLCSEKEHSVLSYGINDQQGTYEMGELEMRTKSHNIDPISFTVPQSTSDARVGEQFSSTICPVEPKFVDDSSIAHNRPRRVIRKPNRYGDNDGLISYSLTVAQ